MRKPEDLIDAERWSLTFAAKRLGVHVGTIFRWSSTRGVRGRRLPTIRIGARRYVLLSDLREFLSAINSDSTSAVACPRTSADQRAEAAERELDRLGITGDRKGPGECGNPSKKGPAAEEE